MDFISIFIVFIVIIMFMMMFLLPSFASKRTQKKMHLALKTIAEKYQANVNMSTIMGDSIIGLDEDKNLVFFYKLINDNEISNVVNLDEVRNCTLINERKAIKNKNENYNKTERLGLQFIPVEKSKSEVVFEFYNVNDKSQINLDVKTLEKWCNLLSMRLK